MKKINKEEMINNIKLISKKTFNKKRKKVYMIYKDEDTPVLVEFIKNRMCQYKDYGESNLLWNYSTIEDFYNKYIENVNNILLYEEISKRNYGEPRLRKPKELTGIKQAFSLQYIGRKNQIFIKNNDVWIKDNDYFSQSISQGEAKRRYINFKVNNKFIYNDNFANIILRNEGWICIRNLILYLNDVHIKYKLKKISCDFYGWKIQDINPYLERFYDNLIDKLREGENQSNYDNKSICEI